MLQLRLLGSLDLRGPEAEEILSVLSQPKRLALLSYLAVAKPRGFHRRDKLVSLFWPDLDQDRARAALRKSLHHLRRSLGDDAVLSRGDEEVSLSLDLIRLDVALFEEAAEGGRPEEALELYRGPLMEGFHLGGCGEFDRWLDGEREGTKKAAAGAAWELAHRYVSVGLLADGERLGYRALDLAPTDEVEVRRFVEKLAEAGGRAAALAFYERFADVLEEELELRPDAESRDLAERIRDSLVLRTPGEGDASGPAKGEALPARTVSEPVSTAEGGAADPDAAVESFRAAMADRYRIESEIDSGGMATVYLAEDLKHDRKVAVKVLKPELAAVMGTERFLAEIRTTARLSHPHILPLHDSGEADGILYYVMPYVAGESLRERMDREGRLSVAETVRLVDEIASALSYSHDHGIVHRDVKPENILLSGGRAVVADFGIGRAVTAAGGDRLTGTGFAVGTPAYMSPEQACGEANIDGRSDVYALGCVAYEMVSGRAPFEADTPQALLAKQAVGTVPNLRASDPAIPLFVERAVERALAKQPGDRFQTAREFAEALTSEMVVARVGRRRWPVGILAAAAVGVALVVAWALSASPGGPTYDVVAVLPPANLMNDPEQVYFVQGVHNALISELQKAGVSVIGRTSVLQYEDTRTPIREIASELRVDAVIEPSVFRAGDSVEIEVRVVDGTTQQAVADPILLRNDMRDIQRLYRGLVAAIAAEIQLALTPQADAYLASARPVDPEAYLAYLKGQFHWYKLTPVDLETALQYYALALERDPGYALAYAGIAQAWLGLQQMNQLPPSEAGPRARTAVLRALDLDSTLVEVQYAFAIVNMAVEWDWTAAEAAFLRAIELSPNYPDVHAYYAHFLCFMQRPDEAIEQMEQAVKLDPLHPLLLGMRGWVLAMAGRYDEAIAQFQELLQTVPNHPVALSGLQTAYYAKGMYEESLAATRAYYSVTGFNEAEEALASGYAEDGFRGAMRSAAETWVAISREAWVPPVEIAGLYLAAGMHDEALNWFERGFEEHDPNLGYMITWGPNIWDDLEEEPRIQDLRRRMNLPKGLEGR